MSELATQYGVHPSQIHEWKRRLLSGAAELFQDGRSQKVAAQQQAQEAELFEQIGRLKMELEWLKKLPSGAEALRERVNRAHPWLSVSRQCALLGLARSTAYYEPARESEENLWLMRRIDEQYLRMPFYGSRRMAIWLQSIGQRVNRKRVQRLMQVMGIEALYPKRRTTVRGAGHKIYPYLLRDLAITRPNQVWSADITYVPLRRGFMYLVAVLDWFSRYVLSWRLSNSLETTFCLEALDEALARRRPEIPAIARRGRPRARQATAQP